MSTASIQSFFSSSPSKVAASEGFTSDEIESALQASSLSKWTPTLEYEECDLGSLEPGPRNLALIGRIVNYYDCNKPSNHPRAAQGCLKIMLADDTGAITVRLWYANNRYNLRLGQLVTLWTVHISQCPDQTSLAPTTAPLFTSIFPEGERNCHFMTDEHSDNGTQFKRPFGCQTASTMSGLMTMRAFTDGGYDVQNGKLMVVVKSVGAKKKFLNKNGTTSELIPLGIFDHTAEATLTLYGAVCNSASHLQPSHTVLLITNPGWRIDRTAKLTINGNTRVDIDPDLSDARWLRAFARRMVKKEHVNLPFPTNTFDLYAAEHGPQRILYTLADVDEVTRNNPSEKFTGYLSILLTELHLVTIYKRNMLMSSECCGIPTFANALSVKCKQCENDVYLRINPRILGPIIDETGQISSGKLIFSDSAWQQLLGRTPKQLVLDTGVDVLRYLEERLLFLRVTLGFGMALEDEVGRLAIWCVKM